MESPKYDFSVSNFAFRSCPIWSGPYQKQFGCVQNCLDESKLVWTYLFWTGPKCFGIDPKHFFTIEFHILNQVQKIWSCLKQFWTNRRTRHRMHCLKLAVSHCSILVFHKSWVRPWRGSGWDRNYFLSFSWNKNIKLFF